MRELRKTVLHMIFRNLTTLLWFELPYKILGAYFVYPGVRQIFQKILQLTEIPYLGQENISMLLRTPSAFLLTVCALCLTAYYIYLEISALLLYCEYGWHKKQISILSLWRAAFGESIRLFHAKNIPLFLLILPLMPFAAFTVSSSTLSSFAMPEFIMDFIINHPAVSILYIVLLSAINYLLFHAIFLIPTVIFQKKSFAASLKPSMRLLKKRKLATVSKLIYCFLFCLLSALLLYLITVALLFLYTKYISDTGQGAEEFRFLYIRWMAAVSILQGLILQLSTSAVVTALYHQYHNDTAGGSKNKKTAAYRLKRCFAILSASFFLLLFSETELSGAAIIPVEGVPIVIAHRAGAFSAPENTLSALKKAEEEGAAMAEIDVQQTKDGTLIVMHDSNFKRISGIRKNVWEADMDEVKGYDAGAYFSPVYAGEKIPTLEEMLKASKGRIDLMIELKYTGRETKLVEKTVSLIQKYGMEDSCVIASMNLDILKQVKELAYGINTVYISTLLLTDNYDMAYIDGYSVETTFLSLGMTAQAHFQNKKIYAWTANSEKTIKKAILYQADGIITDNPPLVYACMRNDEKGLDFLIGLLF